MQAKFARAIDDRGFMNIGWMEPIRAVLEDPILAINFRENKVEKHSSYLDDFFEKMGQIEALPLEIIEDLKCVIAYNSVERFMGKMTEKGYFK